MCVCKCPPALAHLPAHALTPKTRTACAQTSASSQRRATRVHLLWRDVSEANTSRDRQDCLLEEEHQAGMKLPVFSSQLRHGQAGQPYVSHLPPLHRKGNISIFLLKCVGAQG